MAIAAATWLIVGITSDRVQAVDAIPTIQWVGAASGEWNDANAWKNTTTNTTGDATTIMGQGNGSDGMTDVSPALTRARNIVIGDGATVEYNAQAISSDFRLNQGSTLTVKTGATWRQTTDGTYTENRWTRFDPSNLILDGGSFKRTGESAGGDGGGLLMISSFSDDDNLARLGGPPKINIEIKNGGRLENTGQVWFGADDEHSPGTRISININDGHMDLTGGTIPQQNSTLVVDADLAFFYDYNETLALPKNEEHVINFTGPGSITVDSAGINVYRQDELSNWTGGDPVSYQDLWDQGILKANGLSGITSQPAIFSDFFSVTGTPGMDNYILTSLIAGLAGDVNFDGVVNIFDINLVSSHWGETGPVADANGDMIINIFDINLISANWSPAPGGATAVPEPSSLMLLGLGTLAALVYARVRPRNPM